MRTTYEVVIDDETKEKILNLYRLEKRSPFEIAKLLEIPADNVRYTLKTTFCHPKIQLMHHEVVFALNELGLDMTTLSVYLKINYTTLKNYCTKHGVEADKSKCLFNKGVLYDLEDLSKEHKVCLPLIVYAYKRFNHSWDLASFEYLVNEIAVQQRPIVDLAKQLGVSKQAVFAMCDKMGVLDIRDKRKKAKSKDEVVEIVEK